MSRAEIVANHSRIERFVFGAAQIGGLHRRIDAKTSDEILTRAWECGVRRFDTAPHYGAGLSERRLGSFLRQFPRDSFVVSTKVGRLLVTTDDDTEGDEGFFGGEAKRRVRDYSAAGVRRSLAESLQRMGLDRIDTVLIHDPEDFMSEAIQDAYPALHTLREEGVVSSVGAGMNLSEPLTRLVKETDIDTVMIAGRYTLLDRSALDELLPACAMRRVKVIAAGVFNSGLLAEPNLGATFDYAPASPDLVRRAQAMERTCARHGVSLRAAALQFPLRHTSVSSVAVGAETADQVQDSIGQLSTAIPDPLWGELDMLADF